MKRMKERRCSFPGCGKVLSDLNRHPDRCYSHQPRSYQAFPQGATKKAPVLTDEEKEAMG
jgi:hypothetical protein